MIVLDRVKLVSSSRHRVRQVFRLIWQREQWPFDDMPYVAWERLATLVFAGAAVMELPGRIHVRLRDRVVQVERKCPTLRQNEN